LPQPDCCAIDGDERVGVGVPNGHQAEAPQPHVHLTRNARRTPVAVQADESDAGPPSADVIRGRPHARFGVTPELG
jgi:hypothetical protein